MMAPTPEERRPPLTPQLALRVAIIGSFALAMFAIIFFRLWFLQVLSGEKYLAAGEDELRAHVDIPAPRGQILDRSGNVLVDSKRAIAVQISPPDLPVPLQACDPATQYVGGAWTAACTVAHPPVQDAPLYDRLAKVLGKSTRPGRSNVDYPYGVLRLSPIACAVAQGYVALPYADVTVGTDVSRDTLFYLKERQSAFPGVEIQPVWLRTYPLHDLAAQLFGTIGPINQQEYGTAHYKGLPQSAIVGQSGLEWYYNQYLQGTDGADVVQVNALGQSAGIVRRDQTHLRATTSGCRST